MIELNKKKRYLEVTLYRKTKLTIKNIISVNVKGEKFNI